MARDPASASRFGIWKESTGMSVYFMGIDTGTSETKGVLIDIDGTEITAIQGIDGTISVPKAIYNLQGQKVTNPVKGGIYIIDGKKVLVK